LVALNETKLEKEKRHIAREVHDELGQVLTALRMDLSLSIIRHAEHVPELMDALSGMQIRVDHAVQCVRNVANSLRPPVLDMGLETAIEWLSREFTKHGTVACALHGIGDRLEIDDSRAVVIFRIVQEALTNITKYAGASQVDITLEKCESGLCLEIRDNGIGFDLVAVAQRGTLGLLGMRERVIALDGRIEVSSAPMQGTTITIVIPLEPEVAKDSA
jgi:signal transduction histidine kinase